MYATATSTEDVAVTFQESVCGQALRGQKIVCAAVATTYPRSSVGVSTGHNLAIFLLADCVQLDLHGRKASVMITQNGGGLSGSLASLGRSECRSGLSVNGH